MLIYKKDKLKNLRRVVTQCQSYKLKEWQNCYPDQLNVIQSHVEAHKNDPELIEGKKIHPKMTPVNEDQLSDVEKD